MIFKSSLGLTSVRAHMYLGYRSGDAGQGAIDACKIGVTIATRYAAMRPQVTISLIFLYPTRPHIVQWCVEAIVHESANTTSQYFFRLPVKAHMLHHLQHDHF